MQQKYKFSFIATVFNEEKTIEQFLISLFSQKKLPDEIVVVDGGSKDKTVKKIERIRKRFKFKGKFVVVIKKGNRSVGRNEAIRRAQGNIILCSDAGCILDINWLKNIIKPFQNDKIDVVSGYYDAIPNSIFQKSFIPYVLVMPDKLDSKNFLPSTRSMAFTKEIWEKAGGFDEKLSHNEDYAFAKKLKNIGVKFNFQKSAVVYWTPRRNIKQAFIMFYRFALGDAEARIYRPKVMLIFIRYILFLFLISITIIHYMLIFELALIFGFVLYLLWAILKNYKYVNHQMAIIYLPVLQFTSDIAIILGTFVGIMKSIWGIPKTR